MERSGRGSPRIAVIGIVCVMAVGTAAIFISRTSPPLAEPAVQQEQTGEFGGVSLRIEYATTTEARERGLGGRTEIPENYGMLFAFPQDDYYGFWMEDMLVPVDIFWLDAQGQVVFIMADIDPSSYPDVFYPLVLARYVLETAAGFARSHHIEIGAPLVLKSFPSVTE